jgi:nitrogen fixation protein FixH
MNLSWKYVVIGLLGLNFAIVAVTVILAGNEDRATPEPDYYAKAMHWDDHQRQLTRNRDLGWKISWDGGEFSPGGERVIRVGIMDSKGEAIVDATVSVTIYHNAASNNRLAGTAVAESPGVYKVQLPAPRGGAWTVRAEIDRGADKYIEERQCEFPGPAVR